MAEKLEGKVISLSKRRKTRVGEALDSIHEVARFRGGTGFAEVTIAELASENDFLEWMHGLRMSLSTKYSIDFIWSPDQDLIKNKKEKIRDWYVALLQAFQATPFEKIDKAFKDVSVQIEQVGDLEDLEAQFTVTRKRVSNYEISRKVWLKSDGENSLKSFIERL